ncbi:hypothetical protein AOQ88_00120 [Candidatus Riesia sp. GBBU]|nr:hypothetical protein AOQ88_00120 [Candidatus Riesia sp. GBBU]
MKKFLFISFDFGEKNIGVAIGQNITNTATPITNLRIKNKIDLFKNIEKIIKDWNPKVAIVGLPLNMNGTEQKIGEKSKRFSESLRKEFNITTIMQDERLTSIEAKERIFLRKGYRYLTCERINSLSASIILENWFNKIQKI